MPPLSLEYVIEAADEDEEGKQSFHELERYLTEAKNIIVKNYNFVKSVKRNFNGVQKFVNDIKQYRQRLTNPQTWRDHNENTMFLD